ncbi:MAG: hypothetical protein H7323_07400 [Frankiales bacterium]|nr:hypothetical protein [Frankiales bacterium]
MDLFAAQPLSDRTVEALLAGRPVPAEPGLSEALALLRVAAQGSAPVASPALAALLEQGCTPLRGQARSRWRGWWPRATVVVAAGLGGLLTAASASALPPTVQGVVADVVGAVTTFELPRPAHSSAPGLPAMVPTHTPARTERTPSPMPSDDGDGQDGNAVGVEQPTNVGSAEPEAPERQQDKPDTGEQAVDNGAESPAARPAQSDGGGGPDGGDARPGDANPADDSAPAGSPSD